MGLSSGQYIKLHALFQFALATYITRLPNVISDGELVHGVEDGDFIIHRGIFNYPRPRSPLAYTGLALLSMAVMDLAFNLRLPSLNHLFALAYLVRRSNRGSPATWSEDTRRIMRFSALYLRICCLVMVVHICVFYTVARGIATSPDELWGGGTDTGLAEAEFLALGRNSQMILELYRVVDPAADSIFSIYGSKLKIILAYALMETFFCRWVVIALCDEQQETINKYQTLNAEIENVLEEFAEA